MRRLDFYVRISDRFYVWGTQYLDLDFRAEMIHDIYKKHLLNTDRPYMQQIGGLLAARKTNS